MVKVLPDCLELIEKLVYPGSVYEFEQTVKEAIKLQKEFIKKQLSIDGKVLCIKHLCNQLYETTVDKIKVEQIKTLIEDIIET